jgi:hypothetical protein
MTYPMLKGTAAAFLIFYISTQFLNPGPIVEMVRVASIPLSVAVVVAYGDGAFRAMFARHPDKFAMLTLGIVVSWASVALTSTWSVLWRLSGQPAWWVNSYPNSFGLYIALAAAVLHITAPGAVDGRIPKKLMIHLGLIAAIVTSLAIAVVIARPDLSSVINSLRPYVEGPDSGYGIGQHPRSAAP